MSARAWEKWLGVVVALAGIIVATTLPGCQKPLQPVPVSGQVQDDKGERIPQAVLGFHPIDETNKGTFWQTTTDAEGRFSLKCIQGRYKVTLAILPIILPKVKDTKEKPTTDKDAKAKALKAPPRKEVPGTKEEPDAEPEPIRFPEYRSPASTLWTVEVPPEGKEHIVLVAK